MCIRDRATPFLYDPDSKRKVGKPKLRWRDGVRQDPQLEDDGCRVVTLQLTMTMNESQCINGRRNEPANIKRNSENKQLTKKNVYFLNTTRVRTCVVGAKQTHFPPVAAQFANVVTN